MRELRIPETQAFQWAPSTAKTTPQEFIKWVNAVVDAMMASEQPNG